MKKSILKSVLGVYSFTLLFSSCLGESDNSFKATSDFAYIRSTGITTYAATYSTNGQPITSPEIQNLGLDNCYFISYEVKTSSGITSDGFLNATDVSVSTDPIPQYRLNYDRPTTSIDSIAVKSFSILKSYSSNYLGDRWLFAVSAPIKTDGKISAKFYYDENNQIDETGEDVSGKNKIIIDVRFTRSNEDETATERDDTFQLVGDLSMIRRMYQPSFEGEDVARVPIRFRYQAYTSKGEPANIVYKGSWSMGGTGGYYFMDYTTE